MRMTIVAALGLSVSACAAPPPAMPYAGQASLPFAACGDMAALRANLADSPDATRESDAILSTLGVRCVAGLSSPKAPARF